ncbi:MAG: hypothetical protein OXG05_13865 [Gammaproteobacteria bacterium]|nr:hypothetical protein [Gammaproteobacteria bacterium]
MFRTAAILSALLCASTFAHDHSCPAERPYPRGDTCDTCAWRDVLAQYQTGALSDTRESEVYGHRIRVSVACDTGRSVDVDDVFDKISETERFFDQIFGAVIESEDGIHADTRPKVLEIITGICDYDESEGLDDCVMYEICRTGGIGSNCDVSQGSAFHNAGGTATHTAFVPYLPEDTWWWSPGNRYGNLQHEFAHLLDYTYIRKNGENGNDLDWWIEGMPQFIQWKILNERISWGRGHDGVRLLETFTHRWNTSNYYDGMRVISYLHDNAPHMLETVAMDIGNGIYRHQDLHVSWHHLIGHIALRHQWYFNQYVRSVNSAYDRLPDDERQAMLPGLIESHDHRWDAEHETHD